MTPVVQFLLLANVAVFFVQMALPALIPVFAFVPVLALLRPTDREHLTMDDLSHGFKLVSEMIARKPQRMPTASVCFLGARANQLLENSGEPSFESVLRVMHDSGFGGDVYPALWMWDSAPTPVYARYPFPASIESMRHGGF